MFKKFTARENVGRMGQIKSSQARGIIKNIVELYPSIEEVLSIVVTKKNPLSVAKAHNTEGGHNDISLVVINGEAWFFQNRNGPWFPTLRILHRYPDMMPQWQVDEGAIRHMLSGSNVMCPGLTSKGGKLCPLEAGSPVALMAEDKELAVAIGLTTKSDEEVRSVNADIAVEMIHFLNDGLFKIRAFE